MRVKILEAGAGQPIAVDGIGEVIQIFEKDVVVDLVQGVAETLVGNKWAEAARGAPKKEPDTGRANLHTLNARKAVDVVRGVDDLATLDVMAREELAGGPRGTVNNAIFDRRQALKAAAKKEAEEAAEKEGAAGGAGNKEGPGPDENKDQRGPRHNKGNAGLEG